MRKMDSKTFAKLSKADKERYRGYVDAMYSIENDL